ncbi:PucR family transcriptional regulator [Jatrophihabitans endophyticus]|uniref:PucR family transcriptional regulator n=1 Tax=Jatrophihabitans endophyticus TaxID=1206085 RepID=UPI000A03E997|nr:helix-turn-helix domain-containing protein [Jatrophihabitans endophyticus]
MLASVPALARTSLARVLHDLGGTLLTLVHGDPDDAAELGGITIHDPLDDTALPPRSLVLAVGVGTGDDVVRLVRQVGEQGAVGVVLRAPLVATAEVMTAAREAGVALLELARGASWTQLAAMLRVLVAEGDVGVDDAESLGGLPAGDLFALANAVAALLDAPVTIEDRGSRVLAFSGRQDEADSSRVETILGRQVPERYLRVLVERGVFRDLARSDRPVHVDPVPMGDGGFSVPRVAAGVRAGSELLGSIWAAVREPLTEDRATALQDAAKLVALHMLRVRAGADVERRLRADLLGTALEGGSGAPGALRRLGLVDQPVVVLALSVVQPEADGTGDGSDVMSADAALANERQRISDAFAMHLSAFHPRAAVALIAGVSYGLVPVRHGDGTLAEERAVQIAGDFLERVGRKVHAVVGVGPVAEDVVGLAYAKSCADRALRALRERGSRSGASAAARLADVHVESLLIELRDMVNARGDRPTGSVARLLAYDAEHGSSLVDTLRAWLDAFGDVVAASAAVHVHPNTFRYRLRRLGEVGGIDLADADARFVAMLQLRVIAS